MTSLKQSIASYTTLMAFISLGLFSVPALFNGSTVNTDAIESTNDNKASAKKFYDIWNDGDLDQLDNIIAEDYVSHSRLPGVSPGREGLKQWMATIKKAFPDVHFTVEQQVEEGDLVVTRWSATGTHEGEFMGVPASGNKTKVTGINITRYENGLSVEAWGEWDSLGMMQRIGALGKGK